MRIVEVLLWIVCILCLLASASFFIAQESFVAIFLFLLACSTTPLFLDALKEFRISSFLPVSIVLILFFIFFIPSLFTSSSPSFTVYEKVALEESPSSFAQEYASSDSSTPSSSPSSQKSSSLPSSTDQISNSNAQPEDQPYGSRVIVRSNPPPPEREAYVPKLEITVKINDTAFVPSSLHIKRGTTVIWTNEFERIHIIHIFNETGGYKSFARSGKLELGDSFNFCFDEPGEYKVRDLIFNWRQVIEVTP